MGSSLSVIIVESFLQELTNKKRHIESCSRVPGMIYNFNNKNLITFEDSFKSERHMPMAMYSDFETTAPTSNCFNPEQKKYLLCLMFWLLLFTRTWTLEITVSRSYGHSLEQLTTIDYLANDQMVQQLNDIAQEVCRRKCKNALDQKFTIETALIKKTLIE